ADDGHRAHRDRARAAARRARSRSAHRRRDVTDRSGAAAELAARVPRGLARGIDFPAPPGTPVLAVADGVVIRVDTAFVEWTADEEGRALDEAVALGYTPAETLDRLRGRQVWIDHGQGIVSRYAHQ